MSLIQQLISELKSTERDLVKVAQKSIEDNLDFIMFLLKEKQLGEGIMSDGGSAPRYNPLTAEYAKLNPPRTGASSKSSSNTFNYEWTGKWIDSLYAVLDNEGFTILSGDWKTEILENRSGGKITALTEENNDIVNKEIVVPALAEHIFRKMDKFI